MNAVRKKHILDNSLSELEEIVLSLGEKKYRAQQILESLYNGKDIKSAPVPEPLKAALAEKFSFPEVKIEKSFKSKIDSTEKFLFRLSDGSLVEGVVMGYKFGKTFCISCQVGCKMGCLFCTSGENGFNRNLSAGEMLEMVILAGGRPKERDITNIVMMGSGEPLDNYDNTIKFLTIASHHKGLNFSARNISLSTCGIVPNIKKLADSGLKVTLSISLHASNDEARKQIMPVANKYKIKDVINAARYYFNETGRRVLFEYVLIKDINDSYVHAKELSELLAGFPTHVNLITLNEKKGSILKGTSREKAYVFNGYLKEFGTFATIRRVLGSDIEGACGQLRAKFVGDLPTTYSDKKDT